MAIRDFHCSDCDKASELLLRSNDYSNENCPYDGSDQILKQFFTFAPSIADGYSTSISPSKCTGNLGACDI